MKKRPGRFFVARAGNGYVDWRNETNAIGKFSVAPDDSLTQMKHPTDAMVQTVMTRSSEGGIDVMKKGLLSVLCIVAVAGCSTQGQVDPNVMQIATTPLTCSNKTECDLWWQRAQAWVTSHSTYRIESSTDTLIQTAGPDGGKRALAYQITRAPNPDGTATIGFAAHCDGSMGCKPNPWEAGADFKEYVRGVATNMKPSQQSAPSATHPDSTGQSIPPTNGETLTQ